MHTKHIHVEMPNKKKSKPINALPAKKDKDGRNNHVRLHYPETEFSQS